MATNQCEWDGPNNETCDKEAVARRSYCSNHVWSIYQKGTGPGKKKEKAIKKSDLVDDDGCDWSALFHEAITELQDEGILIV